MARLPVIFEMGGVSALGARPNTLLPLMFKGYLAFTIGLGGLTAFSIQPEGQAGIYTQICGPGQSIFIPTGDDENPTPSAPHATACHAICAGEEYECDDESEA